MGFIYKVTNKINGKCYIGQSIFIIEKRFKEHLRDSQRKDYCNRPFYSAINKYGKENFILELIEEVDNNLLNEREKYWIKYYRSYVGFIDCNGYNATLGGDSKLTKDYEVIINEYLKVKSKERVAKNLKCCIETVNRALESNHIKTISNCGGQKIIRINPDTLEKKEYESIRQAAMEISESQGREFQTVRKRINSVILHKQNQKAYGFYWKPFS